MTTILLPRAELALARDLTDYVVIPHLQSSTPARTINGALVRFAGDELPTPFRGEGGTRAWTMSAIYGRDEQHQAQALIDLFERAAEGPDIRLVLRTHYGQAPGLDDTTGVAVLGYDPVPQRGLALTVGFTAQAVMWTPEV